MKQNIESVPQPTIIHIEEEPDNQLVEKCLAYIIPALPPAAVILAILSQYLPR